MTPEEALSVADEALITHTGKSLTDIQSLILRESLAGKTYEKMKGYTIQHFKNEGKNLWKLLSEALNEEVSKTNFQGALEKRLKFGTIPPKPPNPNNYDPSTWVGREGLINDLLTKFDQNTRILWLTGISGVGKTALAECLAVRARDETNPFHWVRLEIFDGQIPDFTTGAAAILAKLGDIDIDPQERNDPKRMGDRLLAKLQSHPYWIQLDSVERLLNLEDSAFADSYWLTFLQQCLDANFPSRLVLTSQALPTEMVEWRDRYPNVWHTVTLPGLSAAKEHSEQLAFFSKAGISLNESNTSLLSQIGEIYEGHPLALQVIAAEIRHDYNNNVDQYWQVNRQEFAQLSRELSSPRLSPVHYNEELQRRIRQRIEKSLQKLPDHALNLLCRSSVFRRPVPKTFWLAMLWDVSEKQQQQAYFQLSDRALIEKEGIHQNQRLIRQHNLVRDIAYDLLKEDRSTWQTAEHKAAELWLNEYEPAADAENIEKIRGYLEAFYHYCDAEDWEASKDILLTSLDTPFKRDEVRFHWQLGIWGYYKEQIILCKQILGKIEAKTDGIWLNTLGNACYYLGKYQEAIDYYQQALVISQKSENQRSEGAALGNLGLVYDGLGEYQQAINYHQQALVISQKISDHFGEGCNLGNLGNAYGNLGQYLQAIDCYQQQLVVVKKINDRMGEGNALCNLGNTYIRLNQYDKALDNLQQSLTICRELKIRIGEAHILKNLAALHLKTNQPQQAQEYCEGALQIARELGIPLVADCEELLLKIEEEEMNAKED